MSSKKDKYVKIPDVPLSIGHKLMEISYRQPGVETNILLQIHGNQAHIIYNRPTKMNSFSIDMYMTLIEYLNWANQNDSIKFIVISGAGDCFSSGNDLANFYHEDLNELDSYLRVKGMADCLETLAKSFLCSNKPIFGIVHGKCIGFAFTQLALFDKVFAVEGTMFMAPLVKIAQGPEMCSSYLFPKIFGQNLAEDLIIKGQVTNQKFLQKYNFLKSCSNKEEGFKLLNEHLKELQELDWKSYITARKLMKHRQLQTLKSVNLAQCQNLIERWSNPALPEFLINYMKKRKQMKAKL